MEEAKNPVLKWVWIIGLIIAVIAAFFWYRNKINTPTPADYATVERGTVSQIVSVTGYVRPASDVDLSFEKSGRISAVYFGVGDHVNSGSLIVVLASGDISAQLAEARASAKVQSAKLAELKNGPRPEDIYISQVDVKNAMNDVVNDVKSSYINSDDAIRNKVDQLFINASGLFPQFIFTLSDSQLQINIESGRRSIQNLLMTWSADIGGVSTASDLTPYIAETKDGLLSIQSYLDKIALAVNALQPSSTVTQTTIDGYKAAVLAGRTNITNSLSGISAAEEKLLSAESVLALKKAGTVKEQIDAQEAQVESSQASILNLEAQLAKTVMRSPISGIVTRQDAKPGEVANVGVILTSVISSAKYQIEANVAEADIAKIQIGDRARVTLDAYGNDVVFTATITKIDPAETVIDGVPTYKTTLQFDQDDGRIKSGMTANTDINGARRENVLVIPGRTVSGRGTAKTVTLIDGLVEREVPIETGLRGSNGEIEVLSGLAEGDRIKTSQ
jgi:HlyD family secretion protein